MNGRSLSTLSVLLTLVGAANVTSAQDPAFHAKLLDNFEVGGDTYADVWANGTTAYIGRFGTDIVDVLDISTPTSISDLGDITVVAPNIGASAQDIKMGPAAVDPGVTLAFVSYDGIGPDMFGIYDLTTPASPVLLMTVSDPGFSTSHGTSYRNDGWIACANSIDDKVALFDLSSYDPSSPPATITAADYTITGLGTGFVHDITLTDDFLFVGEWDALIVYDVRDLDMTAPIYVGEIEGYSCHAVWPTADYEYVVTADERGGGAIRLWKMTDNGASVTLRALDSYVAPPSGTNSAFSAHNPVVLGDRAYVSNYNAGVIVFQIDRISDTWERVASYDTSTTNPDFGYDGCWGVYPLLGDELVVLSDLNEGLFTVDFSGLQFRSTSSRPKTVTPWTATEVNVAVDPIGTDTLDASTLRLYTSIDGAAYTSVLMSFVADVTYTADLPELDCGAKVDYYFGADDMQGDPFTFPADATTHTFTAYSTLNLTTVLKDDFETDKGWTVVNDAGLSTGGWERVTPEGTGMTSGYDGDGSGQCYVTENGFAGSSVGDFDVDGGPTTLTSPMLDFSADDGIISYKRWQASTPVFQDPLPALLPDGLVVEISNGGAWIQVENIFSKSGGWLDHCFRVSDYVVPNATVQVRFVIADEPNDAVTEAQLDAFCAEQFCQDPLATATFWNGGGGNDSCFASVPCVLDATWSSDVTFSGHPGATLTVVWMFESPSSGTFNLGGEILLDVSSQKLLVDVQTVVGGTFNTHSFGIPNDVIFAGIAFSAQGGIFGGGIELCNAYNFVIGF